MRSFGTTYTGALPVILILLGFFIAGCNGSTPVIGDPKVVDPPTPVAPGTNVSVSIDVTSSKPVFYQWKTDEDDGKIIKGATSSAVVWQAPQKPGLYNVYLQVTIDNIVTEKSVAIEVADETDTSIAISTPSPAELIATPSPVPSTSTPTPALPIATPTSMPPSPPSTPLPTNTPPIGIENLEYIEGKVLFEDDFEDGDAIDWSYTSSDWSVVPDETGNYVLRASASDWIVVQGGVTSWQDYAFEFKGKIIEPTDENDPFETPEVRASIRVNWHDKPGCYRYEINLGTTGWGEIQREQAGDSGCFFTRLGAQPIALARDTWYTIRIEAYDSKITVYLDGQLILDIDDTEPVLAGQLALGAPPGATVYYDDIRVVELVPASQSIGEPKTPDQYLESAIRSAQADPDAAFAVAALQAATSRVPSYQDDFSDPSSGFGQIRDGRSFARYEDGVYLMESDTCCINSIPIGPYTDLIAQVDMRVEGFGREIPEFGALSVRRSSDGFYVFHLNYFSGSELAYNMGYDLAGSDYVELANGPLPAGLDTAVGTWHNVIAVVVGNQMAFFVDGLLALSITDDKLTQGAVNLYAGAGSAMQIDNLRIWDLSNPPSAGQPTDAPGPSTPTESPQPPTIPTPIPTLSPDLALETAIRSAQTNPEAAFALGALQAAASRAPTREDDFSDSSSGYDQTREGKSFKRYEDGVYFMEAHPESEFGLNSGFGSISLAHTNVVGQVDMRINAFESEFPSSGLILLRHTPVAGHYQFSLNYNGPEIYYALRVIRSPFDIPVNVFTFAEGTLPAGFDTAVGVWHNIIAIVVNNQMAFFVDGVLVATATDDNLNQGGFSMVAGPGSAVRMDNLRLWDVSDLSPTD